MHLKRTAVIHIAAMLLCVAVVASRALAQPSIFASLYSFTGYSDGAYPQASLLQGSDGSLYGTTISGAYDYGTVFKITPAGALTTLYRFAYGSDGQDPYGGLVQAGDGNFYGTTAYGGVYGDGTIFKMTPAGALTTLHSFTGGTDGSVPFSGLACGSDGNFYGTTLWGGQSSSGVIFKITPGGALTTLHSFNPSNGTDGADPYGALVQGSDGNFYGTTVQGGAYGDGTVYRITTAGALTTLHSFNPARNADGTDPYSSLVQGGDGSFYGTTYNGGSNGDGTVFKVTSTGALTVLYSFTNGQDGANPRAAVIQATDGSFYGTTYYASQGGGTLFKVTAGGALTTLHSFAGLDGWNPASPMIQAGDGCFYGTTTGGGADGGGSLFKISPPAGSTYVFWNSSGAAALWKIGADGSIASASFGPYKGWTPAALTSDSSGNAYILWNTSNGQASVWKIASSLTVAATEQFGPYQNWTATSIAAGPDGHVHLLWDHAPDNEASLFNITLGSSLASRAFGPYAGWQAMQVAVDARNNTRLLWSGASSNCAALWNIASNGVVTNHTFGPFSGWQATSQALAPGGQARILWNCTSTKQASLFTIAPDGSFTSQLFGPYPGWAAAGLAVNNDGNSDLMWNSALGEISIFDIGSTGSFTSSARGPYSGWKPIAIAPGP